MFPNSARVVRSPELAVALKRIDPKSALIAVAQSFTVEALSDLQDRGAVVVEVIESTSWTDGSYVYIHTTGGTHRPLGLSYREAATPKRIGTRK